MAGLPSTLPRDVGLTSLGCHAVWTTSIVAARYRRTALGGAKAAEGFHRRSGMNVRLSGYELLGGHVGTWWPMLESAVYQGFRGFWLSATDAVKHLVMTHSLEDHVALTGVSTLGGQPDDTEIPS